MTAQGAATKTLLLLGLALISAGWVWHLFYAGFNPATGANANVVYPWLIGGVIGGLIFAFATIFKPTWASATAPLYALCEGAALGGISAMYAARWEGIVLEAIGLTFGVAACMLLCYKLGLIRATERFKMGVVAATGAIFFVYLFAMVGQFFFHWEVSFLNSASPVSIGVSVVIVIIAALNLVLDFDMIDTAAAQGAPKYMEWYCAFGLMVTLVWLYLEILRLLAKTNSRR